jgi:hypothetical protein
MIDSSALISAFVFVKPFVYDSGRLIMLIPLALIISLVYKATRVDNVKAIPLAAFLLWITILGGMIAVAIGLYILIWIFR